MLFIRDFERYHGVKIKITDAVKAAGFVLFRKKADELNLENPSAFEECRAENYSIVSENGTLVLNYIGLKSLNHALAALLRLSGDKGRQNTVELLRAAGRSAVQIPRFSCGFGQEFSQCRQTFSNI